MCVRVCLPSAARLCKVCVNRRSSLFVEEHGCEDLNQQPQSPYYSVLKQHRALVGVKVEEVCDSSVSPSAPQIQHRATDVKGYRRAMYLELEKERKRERESE